MASPPGLRDQSSCVEVGDTGLVSVSAPTSEPVLESDDNTSGQMIGTSPQLDRHRPVRWIVAAMLLLVIGLIAAARPGADRPAAEATPPVIEGPLERAPPATASIRRPVEKVRTPVAPGTIIHAEIGLIGLAGTDARSGAPLLVRSIDGIEWQRLEVRGDDAFESGTGAVIAHSDLIRTNDGYAIIASATDLDAGKAERVRFRRLVSDDAVEWRADPAFSLTSGPTAKLRHHDADTAVVLVERAAGNRELRRLLDTLLPEPPDPSFIPCGVDIRGVRFAVTSCDGATELIIDEVIAPNSVEAVAACAWSVSRTWPYRAEAQLHRFDDRSMTTFEVAGLFGFSFFPDGDDLMVLDRADVTADNRTQCRGVPGIADTDPSGLVRVSADGTHRRFPLPGNAVAADARVFVADGVPAVWSDDRVQALDPRTGEWSTLAELADETTAGPARRVAITDRGGELVVSTDGALWIADLTTGVWSSIEIPGLRAGSGVVYVDSATIIAADGRDQIHVDRQEAATVQING